MNIEQLKLLLTSQIVRQQVVAFVVAVLGLLGVTTTFDLPKKVEVLFDIALAAIPVWTIVTRVFKPTPPLSRTAMEKHIELEATGRLPKLSIQPRSGDDNAGV